MQVAFYRGTQPGFAGLFNRAVRWWTHGPYSHCEIVLGAAADGRALCASAANLDGGVRRKAIALTPDKWDLLEIPDTAPRQEQVAAWFAEHNGDPYDTLALFGFVWRRGDGHRKKWFCSEAVAAVLGFNEPWRFDPNTLAAVLRSLGRLSVPE